MMIDRRAHRPTVGQPPLRIVLGSSHALIAKMERVETSMVGRCRSSARPIRSSTASATACHVGLNVSIEVLRETLAGRHATPSEIGEMARLCRVETVE